jgi:diaminohydroxyphosphoribosylaminopyrimidine deaminase / 5-amino-6-(5-phosphoribosylamino)uracil reductase
VHPNPMVGCVLVRDGEVVGEGWHRQWGGPHAEVLALQAAGSRAQGATAYVSLEPCRHEGKTPPCTQALTEAGVVRVVYGARDPGERSGGGARVLAGMGLDVVGPVLDPREARRENPGFFHEDLRRPWVCLKLALSLDGGIARREGERTPITGPEVAAEVHRLRAGVDAILIGARTARIDDPLLTPRGEIQPRKPPARVVLDGRGTLPPTHRLVTSEGGPLHLLTTAASSRGWRDAMERAGVRVHVMEADRGRISLPDALAHLREGGARTLLCEGGGIVARALLSQGLVDRMHLALAPRFLGPQAVPAFGADVGISTAGGPPGGDPVAGPGGEGGGWREGWTYSDAPRQLGADLWLTLEREG